MSDAQPNSQQSGWDIYKRLLKYVVPYWYAFVVSFIGFGIYAATQMGFAKWMEYIVDTLEKGQLDQRHMVAGTVLVIFAFRGVGTFLGQYGIAYAGRHLVHNLRTDLFEQLLQLPCNYFQQNASGQMLSRLTFNVEQVTGAATDALRVTIREGLTVIGLFGYLLYLNWKLTLVVIAIGPVIVLTVSIASKRFRKLSKRIQESVGDVTHTASEAIKGYEVVRIFGGKEHERARFEAVSEHNRRQFMKMIVTQAINTPVVQMLVSLAMGLLVYLAMSPDLLADMSTGEFIAFITAAGMIAKPLRQMTEVNSIIQRGLAAAQSVFEVMDQPREVDQGQRTLTRAEGQLSFRQVDFRYDRSDRDILSQINLEIKPGQTIALVGRSGSGKSTLANLLPRFYDQTAGTICLDGIPLHDFKLDNLRSQIALVNQQVVLFEGTVAQNIAYGALANASREQIEAAARAAHVSEFAERMPEGMDTLVGENGVMLSGGQRQRIAIARAILKDAPVLILDEATSALDTESERHIQAALEQLMKHRTTLVIAHRLSTIEHADMIVVLDQGQILEQGSHRELLARQGAYAHLHQLQFNDGANHADTPDNP